jgi:hypothetical protein
MNGSRSPFSAPEGEAPSVRGESLKYQPGDFTFGIVDEHRRRQATDPANVTSLSLGAVEHVVARSDYRFFDGQKGGK